MAGIFGAPVVALFGFARLTGGKGEVRSDIPALERAFNNPDTGALVSLLFLGGMFAVFGFIHGFMSRHMRQTRLLAASNPKSAQRFRRKVRYGFWDIHVFKLNADGTDMVVSK